MGSYDRDYMRGNSAGGGSGYRDSYSNETHNVIWILIGINAVVFFAGWLVPDVFYEGRTPNGYISWDKIAAGEVWRIFTFPFVHASVFHLALNMLMLYFFGKPLVNSQGLTNFLIIYGMGSLLGGTCQLLASPNAAGMGASASILAVISAFLWLKPQEIFQGLVMFVIPIRAKYRTIALVILGMQVFMLLLSFGGASSAEGTGWAAHLGGYAYGWLHVTFLTGQNFKPRTKVRKPGRSRTKGVAYTRRPDNSKIIEAEFSDKKPDYDAILDKINREGMGSLTDEEREILEKASQSMKGKDPS